MASQSPQFDAIIVGSGITGGWAAKQLTQAGLTVLMLERGRPIAHQSDYTTEMAAPWELPFRGRGDQAVYEQDYPVQRLNRHFTEFTQGHFVNDRENPYAVAPGQEFNWFRSYQLGGRSLTWGRQCYRWSDYDFGANRRDGHGTDWPLRYADLAPWYDLVEEFVGVSGAAEGLAQLPDGRFQPAMPLNVVEQALRARIAARWPERLITIGRTANLTQEKDGRAKCQNRNICARGCSFGAYFSTQSSTLPAAQATGRLTVVTDAVVERIDHDAATGRVTGVRWVARGGTARQSATARMVFLNAGAFNSVHLMLNSASEAMPNGLANNSSGTLGTRIMDHANTLSAIATVPGFEGHTTYGNRPTGIVIPRFRNLDTLDGDGFTRGYSFQGGALQSGWTRGARMAGLGADFKNQLRGPGDWRMVLVAFAESLPRPSNRLTISPTLRDQHGIPQLEIAFAHGAQELAALADAKREAAAMLGSAGAQVMAGFDRPGAGGTAIHEMGGAGMSVNPAHAVLNQHSQAHDIPNLFVTDGAQMNSSACQNPSLTYMALTARACAHAVAQLQGGAI